jgi:hypothetical protein
MAAWSTNYNRIARALYHTESEPGVSRISLACENNHRSIQDLMRMRFKTIKTVGNHHKFFENIQIF